MAFAIHFVPNPHTIKVLKFGSLVKSSPAKSISQNINPVSNLTCTLFPYTLSNFKGTTKSLIAIGPTVFIRSTNCHPTAIAASISSPSTPLLVSFAVALFKRTQKISIGREISLKASSRQVAPTSTREFSRACRALGLKSKIVSTR